MRRRMIRSTFRRDARRLRGSGDLRLQRSLPRLKLSDAGQQRRRSAELPDGRDDVLEFALDLRQLSLEAATVGALLLAESRLYGSGHVLDQRRRRELRSDAGEQPLLRLGSVEVHPFALETLELLGFALRVSE